MATIIWDGTGQRFYESGVDHCVLYPANEDGTYGNGIAWNGITSISESPEGAEPNDLWADNIKYATLYSSETFGGTIEAYTYPDEFAKCDGSYEPDDGLYVGQQGRQKFGFCYRTGVGNDLGKNDYKLHLVFNAMASPSEKGFETINDSPDAITFSWEVTTLPINMYGLKPASLIVIDTSKLDDHGKDILNELQAMLYGTADTPAKLPTPEEIFSLFQDYIGTAVEFNVRPQDIFREVVVNIEPVQTGTGDASPDNPRAITGWTSVKVTRSGRNLLPNIKTQINSSILMLGQTEYYSTAQQVYLTTGTYYISVEYDAVATLYWRSSSNAEGGRISSGKTNPSGVFTVEQPDYYAFWLYSGEGVSASNVGKFQLESGSEATAYFALSMTEVLTISLPSEAGTVYGGHLTLNQNGSGKLVVDKALMTLNTSTMDNNENYPGWKTSGVSFIVGEGRNERLQNIVCNVGNSVSINTTNNDLLYMPTGIYHLSQSEWIAKAMDIQVVLPMATPVTYQISAEQMGSMVNLNKGQVSLKDISTIVTNGDAKKWFEVGDKVNTTWTADNGLTYDMPWTIVHFGDVVNYAGYSVPGMYLQSDYVLSGVMFDSSEALYRVGTEPLEAGTYYFTFGNSWGTNVSENASWSFTTTEDIPAGGCIVGHLDDNAYRWAANVNDSSKWRISTYASLSSLAPIETLTLTSGSSGTSLGVLRNSTVYSDDPGVNHMQRAIYGYNRWSQSAARQWLNSKEIAGGWWKPQNGFDRPPQELTSMRGMMAGLDSEFLSIVKPIHIRTALNTTSDKDIGKYEDTIDRFFSPSLEQMNMTAQIVSVEGEAFDYWKEAGNLLLPKYLTNTSTATSCRLRSASLGNATIVNMISSNGTGSTSNAATTYGTNPVCVIC